MAVATATLLGAATLAVAAGGTAYAIKQGERSREEQAAASQKTEEENARLAREARDKENQLMAQAFAVANRNQAQQRARNTAAANRIYDTAGVTGAPPPSPGRTIIGG